MQIEFLSREIKPVKPLSIENEKRATEIYEGLTRN